MNTPLQSFILAVQFLTRIPTPQVPDFSPASLSRASGFFPAVGLLIGILLTATLYAGLSVDPWIAAILTLALWSFITGALHLDGLSDLADALGASHAAPERFHDVLKDPHIGTFGVVTLIVQLLLKLVLLMLVARSGQVWLLIPICAWARLGPLFWAHYLPVLKPSDSTAEGSGERFSWEISSTALWGWAGFLLLAGLAFPPLLAGPLVLGLWGLYLHRRLGGQTGDALGAGVEVSETLLLFTCVVFL
ncbi:MAG: adenosylcobinamide-GDP ribazoletransferase [Rhodobiaceae bacterium]|nr:MAG: adenosylcobinamide-GDP ribazoletransferase [Rhodobiaceae bacterium]